MTRRKNGLWEARLDLGWQDGKRMRQSFYGKTAREAQGKLDEAKAKAAAGSLSLGRTPTIGAWMESWLEDTARPKLKLSTLIRYRELAHLHIIPAIGKERLDKVTVPTVQRLLNAKQESGLAPQTVHHVRAVLRTALNHAIRCRLVTYNAAGLASSPKIPEREPTYIHPKQARAFLEVAAEDRLGALFLVAFAMGVRQGEALALRWESIDLEARTVRVTHTMRRMRVVAGKPTQLMRTEAKTKASNRVLPLPDFIVTALRHHRERQMFERRAAGDAWQDSGFVFTNPDGTPFEAKQVGPAFKDLLLRAGLHRVRFHDLRHSCATFLMAAHVPPRTVMSYMGHANLATTMKIYAHVSPEMLGEAADTMERLMGTGTTS